MPVCADSVSKWRLAGRYPTVSLKAGVRIYEAESVHGESVIDATPLQEGMLRLGLESEGDGLYVQQLVMTFREPIDPAVLRAAWDRIVARHGILRTAFRHSSTGGVIQEVFPHVEGLMCLEDWSGLASEESQRRLSAYLNSDRRQGFDPTQAPLWRLGLFRCGESDWRCVWTSHHALLDGRSRRHLLVEWLGLHDALSHGVKPVLEAPPRPFADYARWLAGRDSSGSRSHFERLLQGFVEPTPLPMARRMPGDPGPEPCHGTLHWSLSEAATDRLSRRAADWGVSVHNLIQGAWAVLLGQFSGEDDVVFGGVRACRHTGPEGTRSMVGLLINTLPVRVRLPPTMPVSEWIRSLHGQWQALRPHETTSLVQIQAWSPMDAGQPIFDSVVMYENSDLETALQALGGAWKTRSFELSGSTGFPLVIAAFAGRQLRIQLTHERRRIGDPEALRIGEWLVHRLGRWADEALDTVGDVFRMPAGELQNIDENWNPPREAVPLRETIHGHFEGWAARTPDAVALVHGDTAWTYGELNARANRWAQRLIAFGIGPDVPVAIGLERCPEWVAVVLAVLKAGGAYLPLDLEYPAERLRFMLQDAGAAVCVTRSEVLSRIPNPGVPVVLVDGDRSDLEAASNLNPPARTTSEHLAYILYTSGSTGHPKGVAVPHRGVIRLVIGADYVSLDSTRTLLQVSPPTFDASTFELWGALLNGGRCVLFPGRIPTLEGLRRELTAHRVDTLWLTAALFNFVVDEDVSMLRGVRQLLTGGEALSVPHVRKALESLPETVVINGYGPTETTTFATCHRIPRDLPADVESIPIGRPIRRTWVRILDRAGRPVPAGAIGELCIGGPGVARGYLNRPELTAERFIADPSAADPLALLYRTGDRVRWRLDGTVEFLGRLDGQLKIRGHRIEPGEVEGVLRRHAGVIDAAVVGRELVAGEGLQLVAYVVPRDPAHPPSIGMLQSHLDQRLPSYLCPSACMVLPELPRTDHGKVDRRRLPDPEPERPAVRVGRVASPDSLEGRIAGLFSELLGLPSVGVDEDFFRLGGHSLLAMRAVVRARQTLGVELDLPALLQAATPARLAARLLSTPPSTSSESQMVRVSRDEWHPLMLSQPSLWNMCEQFHDRQLGNIHRAYRLQGRLDVGALRDTLQALVDRHECWRTQFMRVDGHPAQRVVSGLRLEFPQTDLGGLPPDEAFREVCRRQWADIQQAFDVAGGRMFRAELLRLGTDDHVLLLGVNHIVFDGWSFGILGRELGEAYGALSAGREWRPAELPFQPVDFASWEHRHLDAPRIRRQIQYWRDHLAGNPPSAGFPYDGTGHRSGDFVGTRRSRSLPSDQVSVLRRIGRDQGCTLSMTLFAALNVAMFRISGIEDVVLGCPLAARHRPGSESVGGCFRQRAQLRTDLSGNPSFLEILHRVRLVFDGALANQDVSLEVVFPDRDVHHPRHWSEIPVDFNFREGLDGGPSFPGLTLTLIDRPQWVLYPPMSVQALADGDQLNLWVVARDSCYSVASIEKMLNLYLDTLTRIVGRPNLRLKDWGFSS